MGLVAAGVDTGRAPALVIGRVGGNRDNVNSCGLIRFLFSPSCTGTLSLSVVKRFFFLKAGKSQLASTLRNKQGKIVLPYGTARFGFLFSDTR